MFDAPSKASSIIEYMEEFTSKSKTTVEGLSPRELQLVPWKPPFLGSVKINSDASWKQRCSGVGCILRDDKFGIVVAMRSFCIVSSPLMVELYAIKEGLFLARRLGLQIVEVELDSREVIKLLCGEGDFIFPYF